MKQTTTNKQTTNSHQNMIDAANGSQGIQNASPEDIALLDTIIHTLRTGGNVSLTPEWLEGNHTPE